MTLRVAPPQNVQRQPFLVWGLVVAALVAALEIVLRINHPSPYIAPDTNSYAYEAANILYRGQFVDFYRGPVYPALMAITAFVAGAKSPQALYLIQQVLYVVASVELFAAVALVTRRPAVSGIIALMAGLYFYPLSYANQPIADGLCAFLVPTLALTVAVFLTYPRPLTLWLVTLVSAVLSLTLSEWFFFPIPLFLYLAWMAQRRGLFRSLWPHLASGLGSLLALVGGYIFLNGRINGFYGVSFIQNPDLLGKVLQYHMTGADPKYQWLDQTVIQYQATQAASQVSWYQFDPFHFGTLHPEVSRDYWALAGNYARSVILHHPIQFALDTIPLIFNPPALWQEVDVTFIDPHRRSGVLLTAWEAFGQFAYPVLGLAVFFAIAWLALLFLRPIARHPIVELMGALALMVGFERSVTVIVVYSGYLREQAPTAQLATILTYGAIPLAVALFFDWRASKRMTRMEVDAAERGGKAAMSKHVDGKDSRTLVPGWQPVRYGAATANGATNGAADLSQGLDALDVGPDVALLTTDAHTAAHAGTAADPTEGLSRDLSEMPTTMTMPYAPFPEQPEISIVLPCLNEEEAIGGCIDTLQRIIASHHLSAEIVVVDNASTDRSAQIATAHGARVVYQPVRGYGNAYLKGFAEARGTYIVMADADNTYDLSEVDDFVQPLREGYDLVMGNRFAGRMAKGAMTFSHRYIGNPILSGMLRLFFRTTVRDAHCGMRAFTRASYPRMRLRTGGMEFASEMVINAAKAGLKITERPISYAPRIGESKLHTVRDGWRHLRFMLLYSPTHLFVLPGILLFVLGLGVEAILAPGPLPLFGHSWDVHTMLLGSVVALLGVQFIMLGLFARFFSLTEELDGEHDAVLQFINRAFTLERGLALGVTILGLGFALDAFVLISWIASGMGQLALVRPTVLGSTGIAIGAEIIFGSFFLSFLQFRKTLHDPDAPLEDAASVRIPSTVQTRVEARP